MCGACGTIGAVGRASGGDISPTATEPESLSLADEDDPGIERVSTGIRKVDEVLDGGVILSGTALIYGGPGAGKSTLTLQIAAGVAAALESRVFVVCPEMSKSVLTTTANVGGVDLAALVRCQEPELWESELERSRALVLVIDSISRMPAPVHMLALAIRWAQDAGGVCLALSHQNALGQPLGPRAFRFDPDTVLRLRLRDDGRRTLTAKKNRGAASLPTVTL